MGVTRVRALLYATAIKHVYTYIGKCVCEWIRECVCVCANTYTHTHTHTHFHNTD